MLRNYDGPSLVAVIAVAALAVAETVAVVVLAMGFLSSGAVWLLAALALAWCWAMFVNWLGLTRFLRHHRG